MEYIKFEPFQTTISPQFWSDLMAYKLHEAKLDSNTVIIKGCYTAGRWRNLKNQPQSQQTSTSRFALQPRLNLDFMKKTDRDLIDFKSDAPFDSLTRVSKLNDKSVYEISIEQELSLHSSKSKQLPCDLAIDSYLMSKKFSELELKQLAIQYQLFTKQRPSDSFVFSVFCSNGTNQNSTKTWEIMPLSEYDNFISKQNSKNGQAMIGFLDPSGHENVAGWPLRNILVWARSVYPLQKITILCFKDENAPKLDSIESNIQNFTDIYQSVIYEIQNDFEVSTEYKSAGWEKSQNGKLLPKMANLESSMDPVKLATSSLDLNLQLMKWRLVPSLDLDKIANSKCLLFGAGTLGCNVARLLLGWGVRKITFIDNGSVSFSNPPRQPLFNFADIGKPKAISAAESLKSIFPGVDSNGVQISIPMPGHYVPESLEKAALEECEKLDQLVQEHDVLFLLTDSRESRWMPTLLGAVHNKLVICVALGFDSFVVMRHGPASHKTLENKPTEHRLGCYFCNDIVAPVNSTSNRSLDQQCTVSRPGLAPISAGIAVELMTSVLQHSEGIYAEARSSVSPLDNNSNDFIKNNQDTGNSTSVLTYDKPIPHQIRGFLGEFKQQLIIGDAYKQCTACSPITEYGNSIDEKTQDHHFNYLESLTGLDELHRKTATLMDEDAFSFEDSDEEFLSI
ncbi:hypothetical protein BB561_006048 [Smittium simulii]|uniref:Ubiquitin-like modifier-activating enzyme ATG7 n=1 Tax=Smittium simulii TaxID=133385 RepID=A0A2T9Y6V8_9FUNG|nr:hypothetical protein BB561_006048 [Smittium simulii]